MKTRREKMICKGPNCDEEIFMVKMMETGKKMPVNATSTHMVEIVDGAGVMTEVYTPHWATCPDADLFKK